MSVQVAIDVHSTTHKVGETAGRKKTAGPLSAFLNWKGGWHTVFLKKGLLLSESKSKKERERHKTGAYNKNP